MTLTNGDLLLIADRLGRTPNAVESAIFENLWSEHCAYRSSKPLLKTMPTTGDVVLIGPGDDAAVVKLRHDLVLAIAMESHNHPSYVDPYDGAATGVGGIVRDVISMGAKPIALTDTLYFGYPDNEKNRYLLEHVVQGIADYGNCIGVPVVNGQIVFDASYEGNPLVNVTCIGLAQRHQIITGKAKKPGNKIILMGSMTGRDGLGGASFASRDLSEESEAEDRPSVQIGDPFTEKLLIDATLEAIDTGHVLSCRDLGAAGLSGASSEMCATFGVELILDNVPLREAEMSPMEILVSESQERMILEVPVEYVPHILSIAEKFDLLASVIGEVIPTPRYVVDYRGEVVADIPIKFLTEEAPICDRAAVQTIPRLQPALILPTKLKQQILQLLASPNLASKEWVYRQYDHEVQTRTVIKPGHGASVLSIDNFGIAISSGCNPKYCALDPYIGAALTVVDNAMKLAVKGSRPLAMVDCLNFGNPEKPEVYWQLTQSVSGLSFMARTLKIPIVGGNVSLYNESEEFRTAVIPTPSIALVGCLNDVFNVPRDLFVNESDVIIMVGDTERDYGGSEYYELIKAAAPVPRLKPNIPQTLEVVVKAVETGIITAAKAVSTGGLVAAIAEMCGTLGATLDFSAALTCDDELFSESCGRAVLSVRPQDLLVAQRMFEAAGVQHKIIGQVHGKSLVIHMNSRVLTFSLTELKRALNRLTELMT